MIDFQPLRCKVHAFKQLGLAYNGTFGSFISHHTQKKVAFGVGGLFKNAL
jgi:hypothetical protein